MTFGLNNGGAMLWMIELLIWQWFKQNEYLRKPWMAGTRIEMPFLLNRKVFKFCKLAEQRLIMSTMTMETVPSVTKWCLEARRSLPVAPQSLPFSSGSQLRKFLAAFFINVCRGLQIFPVLMQLTCQLLAGRQIQRFFQRQHLLCHFLIFP